MTKQAAWGPASHDDESPVAATVVVRVTPRRARIVALTLLIVGAIAALTVLFFRGLEIQRFDAHAKSRTEQTALLNDFNAYSGYVASAVGKPLELFVAMAVQVAVLRVLAKQLTEPRPRWWVGPVALAVSAGVGYLVGNGFNALNVQLRARDVRAAISAADLSSAAGSAGSAAGSSRPHQSLAETASDNPTTNTVLRTLLLQLAPRPATSCPSTTSWNADGDVPDHFLNGGLPRRAWFARVLPRALVPATLRLVVHPTDPQANANLRARDLPMNATLAADLVLYTMIHGREYFGTNDIKAFQNDSATLRRHPHLDKLVNYTDITRLNGSMAEILGLLPPSSDDDTPASETMRRETLFKEIPATIQRAFQYSAETKQSDLSLEFSHVAISPTVAFDAVTLQFEVEPARLANAVSADNATRFTNLNTSANCGPWPGLCLVDKVKFKYKFTGDSVVELPPHVKVLSPCVDARGEERLTLEVNYTAKGLREKPLCPRTSNASLLVVSFAKRLVADAITGSTLRNASGEFPDPTKAVITNLRKIYTFTLGRLSWRLEDLAAANNAGCTTTSPSMCRGLQLALASNESDGALQEHLVVGAAAIPTQQFVPQGLSFSTRPRFVNLAEAYEPAGSAMEPALGGDPLLVHNIGKVTWNTTLPDPSEKKCDTRVEDRLRLITTNHYYSEHSLQPAYTAATWFLFQNAVVKQRMTLEDGRESLDFAANIQDIAVWISTPKKSAWLTLAGCFLLVGALLAAVLWSFVGGREHPLETITDPHVIARVLVNDEQFPPILLRRRVVEGHGRDHDSAAEEIMVGALSLRPVRAAAAEEEPPQTKPGARQPLICHIQ